MVSESIHRFRFSSFISKTPWSLGFALGMIIFFAPHSEWHGDLEVFRNAAETLRHPYWARWIFYLLALPPEPVAFVILSVASTAGLYFAIRAFGGRDWMVFTSFAYAWTLFYGQIDGLVVGGLGLACWALRRERPIVLGGALMLALIKPQMSLPLAVALWWWSPSRFEALIIPAIVFVFTLIQWGWWVPDWLSELFYTQDLVGLSRNISLWPIIGPSVMFIWPLIMWLRMGRDRKILAIAAATALTMPYFPLPSAVLLLAMPLPWWVWAGAQLPLLGPIVGYWVYSLAILLPGALILWSIWPLLRAFAHARSDEYLE
jgi:hypothetical protein